MAILMWIIVYLVTGFVLGYLYLKNTNGAGFVGWYSLEAFLFWVVVFFIWAFVAYNLKGNPIYPFITVSGLIGSLIARFFVEDETERPRP